ncbi:MAG: hypothetical protein A3B70_01190 [Deltaproteobacteria bacterium RIFCSPHIGHO2_02_FULL_40_11]|nr:MAG: hypothetical protein A3B70_01190 [Deltaproteobacteria bacterium RIFCSPHIGHO2_02_FULL_40_11]
MILGFVTLATANNVSASSSSNIKSYFSMDQQGVEVTVYYHACGPDRHTDLILQTIIEDPVDGTEPELGKIMISTRAGKTFPRGYKCLRIATIYDTIRINFWDLYPGSEYEIEVNRQSKGAIRTP